VHADANAAEWRFALLAATALLERGYAQVERLPAGQAIVARLRNWLAAAIRQSDHLSAVERAKAGQLLGRLGEIRASVLQVNAMEFYHIRAGPYMMGSADDDPLAKAEEKPRHEVNLPYAYWLARYPVTNTQFAEFVVAGGYQNPH
jgi:formylglycine-generating enzyme required for sulfatase activity